MKQLGKIIIFFTVTMAVFFAIFLFLDHKYSYNRRDILYYNDLLYKVEEAIDSGVPEEQIEELYNCSIVYEKDIEGPELSVLYSENALVLDLKSNGVYIGKVAWPDQFDRFQDMKYNFFFVALALWLTVFLGGYLIFFMMYIFFIRPVNDLKSFSMNIAKGDLDSKLPIRRNNLFGEFVEAFDIMREELKESHKREMEAEIARKSLVTELSHDVKTPVSVIKATAEVLKMKGEMKSAKGDTSFSEEELKDIVDKTETISAKADTISALMSNLMHATLEDMEKLDVNVDMADSRDIQSMIARIRDYGRIHIKNETPAYLVYMDRLKFEQVLDNIISNSHKYAGTDIEVSFAETSVMSEDAKNIGFLKIRIKDNGPGVKDEDLPLISEKYYRGQNTSDKNGYGLGLYLVKVYMQRMGGGMEYYNDNGFVVELLLKKV